MLRRWNLVASAAVLFPLLLLPLMVAVSRDYGATWDEELQQTRGEKIAGYYTGHVGDLDFPEDGAHLYGAPVDVLAVAVQTVVRADTYIVRHALNAVIGWIGIVFCGLIAARLFDPATALLAMVLLASAPRYFGHSMNNPKDIPFAALAAVLLYLFCRLPERYPFFTWRSSAALALALGFALNIRPGALLFVIYLAVLLIYRLQQHQLGLQRPLLVTGAWMAGITVATLALGSLFWPWALQRPLIGPVLGLAQVSKFGWTSYMLFNGRDVYALDTPWDYVPRWMVLTQPLVVLTGVALSLLLLRNGSGRQHKAVVLWAVVAFPIVYVIGVRAVMYDGLRHLLFIQPAIAVLAAAGWMLVLRSDRWALRGVAAAAVAIGLIMPISFEIREHPNQVVYFNELAGGPAGAYGRYEMDYWGNCILQALAQANSLPPSTAGATKVSGWPLHLIRVDASRFPGLQVVERESREQQLDVVLSRGSRAEVTELAGRADMLFRVATTDGALLCATLPGPAFAPRVAADAHDAHAPRSGRGIDAADGVPSRGAGEQQE